MNIFSGESAHPFPRRGSLPNFYIPAFLCALVLLSTAGCRNQDHQGESITVDSTDTRARNVVQLVNDDDHLNRFFKAFETTGLSDQLTEVGPYTIFAPTDQAFVDAAFRIDTLGGNSDSLKKFIELHVARGWYDLNRVSDSLRVSSLSNESLLLQAGSRKGPLFVQGRRIIRSFPGQNGMVHVIGRIIVPYRPVPADTSGTEEPAD